MSSQIEPQEVYSRKGNFYGTLGIVQTIPNFTGEYLIFTLIRPSRKHTEKLYSAARKKITISSHQELLKYRGLLAKLVGSHLGVKKDQALLDTNLAEFCVRKKLPFLPMELRSQFVHASSNWEKTERGFKLTGPQTIQFSSLVKARDKRVLDPNKNFVGIVEGVTQAKNGVLMLSLLTQIPTEQELQTMLKAWVARRNAAKKIASRLKIPQENALSLRNIMRYRIVQGHFRDLDAFNQFRQEVFQPTTILFQEVARIESDHIVYRQFQNESFFNGDSTRQQGLFTGSTKSSDEEIFYSFEEALRDSDSGSS